MCVCVCESGRHLPASIPVEGRRKGRETKECHLLVGFSNTQDLCGNSHLLCRLHRDLNVQIHTLSLPPGPKHTTIPNTLQALDLGWR